MFSPIVFINKKLMKLVSIYFVSNTMRIQKIEYFPDNQNAITEDIKQDFVGEILLNLRSQHFGEMEVDSWSILLGIDKYIYLVKIPKQKTSLFEQSKDFFKTPQIDVKSAMELMEL